jgi:hypothetical protein
MPQLALRLRHKPSASRVSSPKCRSWRGSCGSSKSGLARSVRPLAKLKAGIAQNPFYYTREQHGDAEEGATALGRPLVRVAGKRRQGAPGGGQEGKPPPEPFVVYHVMVGLLAALTKG